MVRAAVIAARQHLLRFPVLNYFHPAPDESQLALLRGAAGVCVTLRWGVDQRRVPYARLWGSALEDALRQLCRLIPPEMPGSTGAPTRGDAAEERVAVLRRAITELDSQLASRDTAGPEAAEFLSLLDATTAGFARMHGYPHRTVLSSSGE